MTFKQYGLLAAVIALAACTPQELQEASTVYQDVDGTLKTACVIGATGQALVAPVDPALAQNSKVAAANAACAAINATPALLPITPPVSAPVVTPPAPVAPTDPGVLVQ
jgi:hypothetical protein